MKCPRCLNQKLNPAELEAGLVCGECKNCQGRLVSLLNYRHWLIQLDYGQLETPQNPLKVEDNVQAIICQKCNHLMTKYRMDVDAQNRLDYCGHCDEVWFDKGEWELLKKLNHHYHLPHLVTEVWQNQLRHEENERLLHKRYIKLLGDDEFRKLLDFKQWLDGHKAKVQIRQFLLMAKV